MNETYHPTRNPLLALATTLTIILALHFSPTSPRFTYAPLNYAFVIALTVAIPASLVWLLTTVRPPWVCWIIGAITIVVSLPVGLFALIAAVQMASVASLGKDATFEQINEVQGPHGTYRLYRTNGGAMTSFGLVFRRESRVVPGLKMVTVLGSYYPAADAKIELLPDGKGRLVVAPYDADNPRDKGDVLEFRS